jgi:hypothetical protein
VNLNTATGIAASPSALLDLLREATPDNKRLFRDQLVRAIAKTEHAGSSATARPGASGRLRVRLLAYQEIFTFDDTGAVEGLASNVMEAILELNELYTFALRFDVARHLLQKYTARWPRARPLAILPPIVGQVNGPVDGFRDNRELDVQIAPGPASDITFAVFCGLRHAFGVQLNVLHHCSLAKHGVNVVYLRDFAQNLYLTGVSSIGDLRQTCDALRDTFTKLNSRKLIFIGNSSGVFGALHYGGILGADRVLLFSGPTSLEIGLEESERQAYPRLLELRLERKIEWPNLREIYTARSTPVLFYYGSENRVDVAQAENLGGLPNVRLHPVSTSSHFVLDYLAPSGEIDRIFASASRC